MSQWKIILAALIIFASGVVTGGIATGLSQRATRRAGDRPPHAVPPAPGAMGPSANDRTAISGPTATHATTKASTARPPGWQRLETFRHMTSSVTLTPEQQERITARIRDTEQHLHDLWDPVAPNLRRELAELRRDINRELNPEQRHQFEDYLRRRREAAAAAAAATNQSPATPVQ